MTDKTEAPERIWAWKWNTPGLKDYNKPAWCAFAPTFKPWRVRDLPTKEHWFGKLVEYGQTTQEYIRADLSDARIAELEANINIKADWIEATINDMAAQEQELHEMKARITELEAKLAEAVDVSETLRPVWAQGWTNDSMAAQASGTALAQIWKMLGAKNQTQAIATLAELKGGKDG